MSGQIYLNASTKANLAKSVGPNASILTILAATLAAPVDEATRRRAASHVLDWLGTTVMGAMRHGAAGFRASVAANATGPCRVIGAGRTDWWSALQVNAALGNIMEMDDLHRTSILHPGPVIVPGAIAVAEHIGATGEALLDAIVRGYEATIRIGRALGTGHYKYFHNTSTCGSFGAAAASASLLRLSPLQTTWALANAGSRTGGLWQMRHEACETKSLHNAMAAQTGVQSAFLAMHGVRGPTKLLEGPQGLFAATADHADPHAVVLQLDSDPYWLIHDVSFKPWPACRHAHPAIDAAMVVAPQVLHPCIASVLVETYKSAIDFCDKPNPTTELEAKFSLQHSVAVALLQGAKQQRPTQNDFAPAALSQPDIVACRNLVKVVEDQVMTRAFPRHYQARVTVTLDNGAVLAHTQHDAWGDPELPLSMDGLQAKFRELVTGAGVSANVTKELLRTTLELATTSMASDWTAHWPTLGVAK